MTDTMPNRESPLLKEIGSKRVLQDEQVATALNEYEKLLYYISGGQKKPKFDIKDKVRPEDGDLRGWFTQAYGKEYLALLTSKEQNVGLEESLRINAIIAKFSENAYGFDLRVGSVNEYHIGRIISHASKVYQARKEASAYSKEIATLCIRLLFSGDPPDQSLFPIMHTSIYNWYQVNEISVTHVLDAVLAKEPYYSYCGKLLLTLFDMHKGESNKDNWHTFVVPGFTEAKLNEILSGIDGVNAADLSTSSDEAKRLNTLSHTIEAEIDVMKKEGHHQLPRADAAFISQVQYAVNLVEQNGKGVTDKTSILGRTMIPVAQNLTAYKQIITDGVGSILPRNIIYDVKLNFPPLPAVTTRNTDAKYYYYDAYRRKEDEYAAARSELTTAMTVNDALKESDVTAEHYYDISAVNIYNSLMSGETESKRLGLEWLQYCYARVKSAYQLDFDSQPINLKDGTVAPYPAVWIPTLSRGVISADDYIDIGKIIYFYAKAYQGITPLAYWSSCLGKRLVVFEANQTSSSNFQAYTDIYMYKANMATGGINVNTGSKLARVSGTKENAIVTLSSYLPEIPIYAPGQNENLTGDIKNSFSDQIAADETFAKWVSGSRKNLFSYAYIINSAWNSSTEKMDEYPLTKPNSPPGIIYYQTAGDIIGSKYKGVKTFKPSKEYLKVQLGDPTQEELILDKRLVVSDSRTFEGSGALHATEMKVVAFPKNAVDKIVKFLDEVPVRIAGLLNKVNDIPDSGWYDAAVNNTFSAYRLYGTASDREATDWPQFVPANRKNHLYPYLEYYRTFLLNRTESLFISKPGEVLTNGYKRLHEMSTNTYAHGTNVLKSYSEVDFGDTYYEYLGLLGAVAYLNSHELFTDKGPAASMRGSPERSYPQWCQDPKIKSVVEGHINTLLLGAAPMDIYTTQINDTQDIVKMHKYLSNLKAFEGMREIPVFDVKEFHIKWKGINIDDPVLTNPFRQFSDRIPLVPKNGLKASAYPGLSKTYGDVFYNTILDTAVVQPTMAFSDNYSYSKVRIPVNTRGVDGKVYGLRPGTIYTLDSSKDQFTPTKLKAGGSGRVTFSQLGVATGAVYVPIIAYLMYKNFGTGYTNQRWKMFD